MCGIGIAGVLVIVFHVTNVGWLLGLMTGWLLCAGVNKRRR
jgi:hypothetical protein